MSFQFLLLKSLTRLICTSMLICTVSLASGQTILNGDGTTLTTTWCHNDTMHHIIGQPAGGTFSGCGVIEDNGSWYFNPAVAAAGQTSIHYCTLTYTPPQENPVSVQMAIQMPLGITLREDSIITCDGSFFLFADFTNVGSVKWRWSPGEDLDDSTQKGTGGVTFQNKVYTFYAQNMNNGCTDEAQVRVYYEGIDADFTVSKDTICIHEEVHFTAENLDPVFGYAWASGDGVSGVGETWQHTYHEAGVYDAAHILNNEHCYDTLIRQIVVRDFTLELAANPMRVDRGAPITLQTAAGESYHVTAWHPAGLFGDQTAHGQQIMADTTRTYTVVGASAYGCVDSAQVTVEVNPVVYIPSSFSPNGDGRNDFFRIVNWGDLVTVTQFRIYDRWGREVWVGNGANAFTGWDGNYNGAPAEMGVYYYVFEGQLPSGATTTQQGDVTLLR